MGTPRRILLASHSPTCTTGYGRVTRRLAHAFGKAGHAVAVVGMSFRGGPHELPYRIFPWQDRRPGESFAAACRQFRPEVLLKHRRSVDVRVLARFAGAAGRRVGGVFPGGWAAACRRSGKPWIAAVDVPVTFCRFTAGFGGGGDGEAAGIDLPWGGYKALSAYG